ncbi:hypothetical protein MATL_G00256000 [Megalops atlanticus]|uniref:Retinoic acid receptor responder protein 2 n=1 Tax=Megalops atlanticus TaxID=7932 RepID=A0A9D3P9Z4_MEGAT|nr:hypothetical protein MATL_G00256000 [Megalops atlanticus]
MFIFLERSFTEGSPEQRPQSSTESKMSRPLLILLLSTGALLITTEAQQSFHTLPQLYKKTVNLAIRHANKDAQQHMNYRGIHKQKEDLGFLYTEIHLKPTTCTKTEVDEHRDECPFLPGKNMVFCVVCGRRSGSDIQEPYTDCTTYPKLRERENIWKQKCVRIDVYQFPPPGTFSISMSLDGRYSMDADRHYSPRRHPGGALGRLPHFWPPDVAENHTSSLSLSITMVPSLHR